MAFTILFIFTSTIVFMGIVVVITAFTFVKLRCKICFYRCLLNAYITLCILYMWIINFITATVVVVVLLLILLPLLLLLLLRRLTEFFTLYRHNRRWQQQRCLLRLVVIVQVIYEHLFVIDIGKVLHRGNQNGQVVEETSAVNVLPPLNITT